MPSSRKIKPGVSNLRWSLDRDGSLALRREGISEEVLARGRVIAAGPAEITAGVEETQRDQNPVLRTVTLGGKWSLDAANRLVFTVARKDRKKDALVFGGAWKAGTSNEIAYSSDGNRFSLSGEWSVADGRALALKLDTGDVLRVRGSLGTSSVRAKKGELRWRIGAEARKGARLREIALVGEWKIGRDLGVEFELEGEKGRRRALRFGAVYEWGAGKLSAHLAAPDGRPVGLEVEFEKPFPRSGGEAFVRLKRSAEEALAEAGLSFRW